MFSALSLEGVWHTGELEVWGHLTIPAWDTGGRTTNVHAEEEIGIPVDGTGEAGDVTKIDGEVAIGYSDTLGSTVETGFGPDVGATTAGGTTFVEFELYVVVTIWGNGTSATFQAGLEVEGWGGGNCGRLNKEVAQR